MQARTFVFGEDLVGGARGVDHPVRACACVILRNVCVCVCVCITWDQMPPKEAAMVWLVWGDRATASIVRRDASAVEVGAHLRAQCELLCAVS